MQIKQATKFSSFEKALSLSPEEIIKKVEESQLLGRGGANFPTGTKWKFTSSAPGEKKYLICNFDEGEPGTFKDKFIADNNPDNIIEGIAIASYAIGIKQSFIYLRGEYSYLYKVLEKVIKQYENYLKKIDLTIEIFQGAGAYICGDETAIISSIEDKRGEPRPRPPYPAQKGLWGCPTVINNVETLANIPLIIRGNWQDLHLFSVSGSVENPGIFELAKGTPTGKLIEQALPRQKIKALFLGCAGGCIPYDPQRPLDIYSTTIIAVDAQQSIPLICKNIAEFFVHESCGKCTPCREGTWRVLEILEKIVQRKNSKEDLGILQNIINCMTQASLCGLGQTAGKHIDTALKYFKEEFS